MTTNTLLSSNFLRVASFFDASECIAVKATCRRARPLFWENENWWKEVITPIQEIERQFGACLEPETRHLLRRRTVFNPATEKFVQERVSQLRTVCDQLKQDQLPPYDTALVLRHAVTMTSYGRHLPVHPVLASLEGGVQGKGQVQILFENRIAVLTQGQERVAKLLKVDAPKIWENAREYTEDTLKLNRTAYEMMAALGSCAVAPTRALQDGTVAMYFIPNSTTIHDLISTDVDAAKKLAQINSTEAQLHMLMHLIRGRFDGHGSNTIVTTGPRGDFHLYDIDEEQNFPCNNVMIEGGDEGRGPHGTVFGLPSAGAPLSSALLRLFALEGWKEKCLQILSRYDLSNRMNACAQRCDKIRAICMAELSRENSSVTPRDFFFAIFGKDYLFEMALRNGVPPMIFFSSKIREYDDFYRKPRPWKAEDLQQKTCEALEPLQLPQFSMHRKEQYPGRGILYQIQSELWENPTIRCLEIPPDTLDGAGWVKYQQENSSDSVALQSFMLSHFLKGFPKRVVRQISILYPHFPLKIVRDEADKLWLEMIPPPLLKKFNDEWEANSDRRTIQVIKLEPHQVSLPMWKKIRPSEDVLKEYKYDLSPALSGEIQLSAKLINQAHGNGYLDIEQRLGGLFLVFKYNAKDGIVALV